MPPARAAHKRKSLALPRLAFGAKISSFTTDPLAAAERSASALTCLRAFEPTPDAEKFAFRAADVRVGELTMVANSASGMTTKADGAAGFVVALSRVVDSTLPRAIVSVDPAPSPPPPADRPDAPPPR